MELPLGYKSKDHSKYVCKLRQMLYGLKQSLRERYHWLKLFLKSCDITNSVANSFVRANKLNVVCVDGFVITGNHSPSFKGFIKQVCTMFQCHDLGHLSYFLRLEANKGLEGLHIFQRKYSLDLLQKFGRMESKLVDILVIQFPTSIYISLQDGNRLEDTMLY